jgi:hypothetical protein
MRKMLLGGCSLLLLAGCGSATTFVHSDTTTLGRVVVYRNGVAYFERYATVDDDKLTLAVPADKVDDFLKSLNVVDARTGEPAPVAYPTDPEKVGTGLIDMEIKLPGPRPHQLKLSYVTEAPAWKPSYRVVLGDGNKVQLIGWAVVDNTSGEDWKSVKLGVGASSALSFRFDLRSVRLVERETLQTNDLFAMAPPTGEATYGGPAPDQVRKVVGDVGDETIASADDGGKDMDGVPEKSGMTAQSVAPAPSAASGVGIGNARGGMGQPPPPPRVRKEAKKPADPLDALAQKLRGDNAPIIVEGYGAPGDSDRNAAALDRANRLREQLSRRGVDPNRIVAVGKGDQAGHNGGARIVEALATPAPAGQPATTVANPAQGALVLDPIGTSHFESQTPMTVEKGTSAMVSILHTDTEGEVVYLFDPESPRGNAQFAFKSLRLRNPTDSQLESGPLTVFGEGRFIGEGLSEPIPGHQLAFVPFALDRQIVVDHADGDRDEIAKIMTVQRGVFSTQMQHIHKTTFVLHNRLPNKAVVYVRHTVPNGYRTSKAPGDPEHVSGADMYRVEVDGYGKADIALEDSTPIYKSTDIRDPAGMELVRVYLSSAAEGALKGQVDELVKTQKEIGDDETRIATLREQMGEYRQRMDELHAQIVTLRAVKTAGPLMTSLEKKLSEVSDKLSKATIDVVALEEKLMLSRIKFQDGVADLTLEQDKQKGVAQR